MRDIQILVYDHVHINQTFPIVSEYSRFYTSADNVEAANDAAKETGDDFSKIDAPIKTINSKHLSTTCQWTETKFIKLLLKLRAWRVYCI